MALAGCGGGGEAAAPPADAGPVTDPAAGGAPTDLAGVGAAGAAGAAPAPLAGKDPQPVQQGDAVSTSEATPKEFVKVLGRQPIVVFMYQPRSDVDELFRAEVRAAVAAVKGVKYFEYRLQDYDRYRDLPERVGAMDAPAVSIVSRDGTIQNYFTAFTDRNLLTLAIQVAANKSAAPVTNPDIEGTPAPAGTTGSAPAVGESAGTADATTPVADPAAAPAAQGGY